MDTLEILRCHHAAMVRGEREREASGRRRNEADLRRLLPLLRAQAEQWEKGGGSPAGCVLTPLIENYEARLSGHEPRPAAEPDPAVTPGPLTDTGTEKSYNTELGAGLETEEKSNAAKPRRRR